MIQSARIGKPIDVGRTMMILAAEDDYGPLRVRIGLAAWEQLRMAPPYLDDEDRRDAVLLELEKLCISRVSGGSTACASSMLRARTFRRLLPDSKLQ